MIRNLVWLTLFLCIHSQASEVLTPVAEPTIRIRVEKVSSTSQLKAKKIKVNGILVEKSKVEFSVQLFEKNKWLLKIPKKKKELVYESERLVIDAEKVTLNNRLAPAHIEFVQNASTALISDYDAVATLALEEYLLDVVASEVPSQWPLETLKAQAVAARSYALVIQAERKDKTYHIDSSTQHQVFQYKRHLQVKGKKNIIKAVEQTAGQILVDSQNTVFKTYFHAHCGGESEDPGAIWSEPNPNFKPLYDKESCETSPSGAWVAQVPESEFLAFIEKKENVPADQNQFVDLKLNIKPQSRRIETIEIVTTKATHKLRSQNFREAFGFTRIKSTIFSFENNQGVLNFKGQGYGHGAGLCQTGSRWMGASGSLYSEILARYYSEARLSQLSKL